ncbi:MAG: T9SS type A sorting domain-containing protein [Bacteroidota bacterium]
MKKLVLFVLALLPYFIFAQTGDHSSFVPMPMPRWSPPTAPSGNEHYFIGYDVVTGKATIIDTVKHNPKIGGETSEPFIPADAEVADEIIGAKNFNDLTEVSPTTTYPWRAVVKLFMTFPSSNQFVGSGILVNSRYVLTAGHCVYSSAEGGWATSIEVVPGYYSGNQPYGNSYASNMFSWTGWTNSGDFNWDMGYIKLNSDIGTSTGWLGYGYNDDAFFQTNTFHNPGYPAETPYDGSLMYYWYGTYDQVMTKLLYFNKYCYGGQSGSGSYYKDGSNNRYVYAILSHYSSVNGTGHVRITGDMFGDINTEINSVAENDAKSAITCNVFPNPAEEFITCNFNLKHLEYSIKVFDLSGKQLIETNAESHTQNKNIDISRLCPGFYCLTISDGTNTTMRCFIKK